MSEQKITINGSLLSFEPGQTILEIAEENGIKFDLQKISSIIKTYLLMVIPFSLVATQNWNLSECSTGQANSHSSSLL